MFKFLNDNYKTQFKHSVVIAFSAAFLCVETLVLAGFGAFDSAMQLLPYVVALISACIIVYNLPYLLRFNKSLWQYLMLHRNARGILFLFLVAGGGITLRHSFYLHHAFIFLTASALAIAATYFYIKPPFSKYVRSHFFLKNIILITVYSVATVLLPLLFVQQPISDAGVWLIFLRRTLFIGALLIPFEMRDMDSDAQRGFSNVVNFSGIANSKMFALMLLLLFMAVAWYQFSFNAFFLALNVSAIISVLLIFLYQNEKKISKNLLLLIDSMPLLQGLLVIGVSLLSSI